ncbi:hypothetical protein NCC49_000689 [Naganishia albida]|nr:hypothetical protein NCC49_000689 [Naganishia albida]
MPPRVTRPRPVRKGQGPQANGIPMEATTSAPTNAAPKRSRQLVSESGSEEVPPAQPSKKSRAAVTITIDHEDEETREVQGGEGEGIGKGLDIRSENAAEIVHDDYEDEGPLDVEDDDDEDGDFVQGNKKASTIKTRSKGSRGRNVKTPAAAKKATVEKTAKRKKKTKEAQEAALSDLDGESEDDIDEATSKTKPTSRRPKQTKAERDSKSISQAMEIHAKCDLKKTIKRIRLGKEILDATVNFHQDMSGRNLDAYLESEAAANFLPDIVNSLVRLGITD